MLTALVLISAATWQATTTKTIQTNSRFAGKAVKVCVDKECVKVDRSNEKEARLSENKSAETLPSTDGVKTLSSIDQLLSTVSDVPGEIEVESKETKKEKDGSERTTRISIKVKN